MSQYSNSLGLGLGFFLGLISQSFGSDSLLKVEFCIRVYLDTIGFGSDLIARIFGLHLGMGLITLSLVVSQITFSLAWSLITPGLDYGRGQLVGLFAWVPLLQVWILVTFLMVYFWVSLLLVCLSGLLI